MASHLEVSRSKDMLQLLWIYGKYVLIPFNFSHDKSQVDFKRNHEPSPREYKPLQYLLEQLYRELANTQGNQTVRRNQNQFLSVYTAKKFHDMQGTLCQKGGELNLQMHLDLLMGHFMLLRSQNRLGAELVDLFTVSQVNEGPHGEVNMLFLLLREGKVVPYLWFIYLLN